MAAAASRTTVPSSMRQKAPRKCRSTQTCMLCGLSLLGISYFIFMTRSFKSIDTQFFQHSKEDLLRPKGLSNHDQAQAERQLNRKRKMNAAFANRAKIRSSEPPEPSPGRSKTSGTACPFREYPPRRYYGLSMNPRPDFLQNAEYVFGAYPILLKPSSPRDEGKLCVNQTSWHKPEPNRLPFADGTNPSLLRLDRLPKSPLIETLQKDYGAVYLGTVCMTDSQCAWKDTPEERIKYNISDRETPITVRTILVVLNEHFETLLEASIYLEKDKQWGSRVRQKKLRDGTFGLEARALDDARLFLNREQVWISFREGKSFGYDKQVINPIHLELQDGSFKVTIKASESASFCCGRNMALMQHPETGSLQSLTWADPITVVDVNDSEHKSTARRRLTDDNDVPSLSHRQLGGRRQPARKSHFHGTNAFMLPLPSGELLGIGHFHRPPGRDQNEYARFGHHYTHAFFTITRRSPHKLQRLSQEFVLPSKSHVFPDDAGIIQFASALELDVANDKLVVGYGINDCEGAIVTVDIQVVEKLLTPVEQEGQEVIDLMQPLKN